MMLIRNFFLKIPVADKVKVNENAANVALLRPSEQSSTFASKIANLAVDGNPGSAHHQISKNNDHLHDYLMKSSTLCRNMFSHRRRKG